MYRAPTLALCAALLATAAPAQVVPFVEARVRAEAFDAPAPHTTVDSDFVFVVGRVRAGADAGWGRWTLHGVLQGAAIAELPDRPSFGPGAAYAAATSGDPDVGTVGLLEASLGYDGGDWAATVGRQAYADGGEVAPGVPYLDRVKRERLAERLVGNWDWTNVGRRFDGLSAWAAREKLHTAAFFLQPTAGGVDHDDGLERLPDLSVWGFTATGRHGQWVPGAELRAFLIGYDDSRPGALQAAGGPIELLTLGGSLLAGGERGDLLVWAVHQEGDWGPTGHGAWAAIVEAGRQFPAAAGRPALRLGIAQASGDETPGSGRHATFFNLLPTNHKWYGAMDFNAFSNLRDVYATGAWQAGATWGFRAEAHGFWLPERQDAWWGGSGAANEGTLGYAARRAPGDEAFPSSHLGWELDLEAARSFPGGWSLGLGVSWFAGGDAAEAVVLQQASGAMGFLQVAWRH